MFELTINGNVYGFNFGMGFMREMNKRVSTPVEGLDIKKNIGLQYSVAGIIDGDVEELVNVLEAANKGQDLRITRQQLDNFIDDENTDIDKLFEDVLDFLKRANATRKVTVSLLEELEKRKQQDQ